MSRFYFSPDSITYCLCTIVHNEYRSCVRFVPWQFCPLSIALLVTAIVLIAFCSLNVVLSFVWFLHPSIIPPSYITYAFRCIIHLFFLVSYGDLYIRSLYCTTIMERSHAYTHNTRAREKMYSVPLSIYVSIIYGSCILPANFLFFVNCKVILFSCFSLARRIFYSNWISGLLSLPCSQILFKSGIVLHLTQTGDARCNVFASQTTAGAKILPGFKAVIAWKFICGKTL